MSPSATSRGPSLELGPWRPNLRGTKPKGLQDEARTGRSTEPKRTQERDPSTKEPGPWHHASKQGQGEPGHDGPGYYKSKAKENRGTTAPAT